MRIKTNPEDFQVTEILDLPTEKGKYDYYLLQKRGWNTLKAIQKIAQVLKIKVSSIGYAGNKDKQAVTKQYISITDASRKKVESLEVKDLQLTYISSGSKRIVLGDLRENSFVLIVRDLSDRKPLSLGNIKNYFDEQRFGVEKMNAQLGKLLVQRKFKDVCDFLELSYEGKDYMKALRTVEKRLLRLYVSAYQSSLWNVVAEQVTTTIKMLPLVGFLTELTGDVQKLYDKVLKKEGITPMEFLFREFPELSSEGGERALFIAVQDFSYTYDDDELHPMRYKCTLQFRLPKGAYATMVVKQLFS